jgi:hypothetical protein
MPETKVSPRIALRPIFEWLLASVRRFTWPARIATIVVAVTVLFIGGRLLPSVAVGPRQAIFTSARTLQGDLEVSGWIDRNQAYAGEPISFELYLRNASGAPITVNLARIALSDLEPSGKCWSPNREPVCSDSGRVQFPLQLIGGASVSLNASLQATNWPETVAPEFLFRWQDKSRAQRIAAIDLGPVRVTSSGVEPLARGARRLYRVLKDLALPLLLVAAGLFGGEIVKKHFKRRAEEDEKRALVNQVWGSFLPKALADAQTSYMPMMSRMTQLIRTAAELEALNINDEAIMEAALDWDDDVVEICLCKVIIFARFLGAVRAKIGGVHFRNLEGEAFVGLILRNFQLGLQAAIGEVKLARVLRAIKPSDDIATVHEKLGAVRRFRNVTENTEGRAESSDWLRKGFVKWCRAEPDSFFVHATLVGVCREVMGFEVNEPLAIWYDVKEDFAETGKSCRAKLEKLPEGELRKLVLEQFSKYEKARTPRPAVS